MSYTVTLDSFTDSYDELKDMYYAHYVEIYEREGKEAPIYNPRLSEYAELSRCGSLLNFVLRDENGVVKGYCNIFLNTDMYNQQLIAIEDTIYIDPEHRRSGAGTVLGQCVLLELRRIGVKRFSITVSNKAGIVDKCIEHGFKPIATQMIYNFD